MDDRADAEAVFADAVDFVMDRAVTRRFKRGSPRQTVRSGSGRFTDSPVVVKYQACYVRATQDVDGRLWRVTSHTRKKPSVPSAESRNKCRPDHATTAA